MTLVIAFFMPIAEQVGSELTFLASIKNIKGFCGSVAQSTCNRGDNGDTGLFLA